MKKLGVIQEGLGSLLLSFRTKWNNRKPKFYTFDNAKTIGILYDATNKNTHQKVSEFANMIVHTHPNTVIQALGFLSNPETEKSLPQSVQTDFFSAKDFNWTGGLIKGKALDFTRKRFDILFDITTETSYPLHYIALASKASYKVGRYIENDLRYDLLIDTKKENTIEYLILQINVYLTKIKAKQ